MFKKFPKLSDEYGIINFIDAMNLEIGVNEESIGITYDNNEDFRCIVETTEMGLYDTSKDMILEDLEMILSFNNLNEAEKDIQRIESMKKKSGGNINKMVQYAHSMANSIKDKHKALARGTAAIGVLGDDGGEIARIFFDKAKELGLDVDPKMYKTLAVKETPMPRTKKTGKDLEKAKKKDGRDNTGRSRPSPILPVGSINFITGNCKYFNVYETWGDSTMEIWEVREFMGKSSYRAVCTSGYGPNYRIGSIHEFQHDQTGRPMFRATMVDWVEVAGMMNLVDIYGKSMLGYTYK